MHLQEIPEKVKFIVEDYQAIRPTEYKIDPFNEEYVNKLYKSLSHPMFRPYITDPNFNDGKSTPRQKV